MRKLAEWIPGTLRRLARDRSGAAALEFALLSPLFLLILAGVTDVGGSLATKMKLDSALSASTNYALVNADKVTAADGTAFARNAIVLIGTDIGSAGSAAVVVNNGPEAQLTAGKAVLGGTAANADRCYCPQTLEGEVKWGEATTCGTACPAGGFAGRFVFVKASRAYTPLFPNFSLVEDGVVRSQALIQVK